MMIGQILSTANSTRFTTGSSHGILERPTGSFFENHKVNKVIERLKNSDLSVG